MSPYETFLIPGQFVLRTVLSFLQLSSEEMEPSLLFVLAGFISWVIWMAIIRAVWAITLKIFGFEPKRRF